MKAIADLIDFADLERRLTRLAAGAPDGALLSVSVDLGAELSGDAGSDTGSDTGGDRGSGGWLAAPPPGADFGYWARPGRGEYRLDIGRAVACTSAGPARFTALQAAHAGLVQHWRHDADDSSRSIEPVASLGFAFDDEKDGEAGGERDSKRSGALPNAQLAVAAIQLATVAGRRSATFTTAARERSGAIARWQALLTGGPAATGTAPLAASTAITAAGTRPDTTLAARAWQARVAAALAAIAAGEIDKVVLSRNLRLALPPAPLQTSAFALLRRLCRRQPAVTIFAAGNAHAVFVGATPEQLVGLAGGRLHADALAGTAWAGEPLAVAKNTHEQRLVVDAIAAALAPLCQSLDLPPAPRVLQLRDLQHLWTPVGGTVRAGVSLFDLVARLHPTPAVGGWPTAAACDWLRRHGERRPGWYGGGVGWIDRRGDGEVAVALRCGLLTPGRIELSAGAGIVAGSQPAHEFGETEAKLATMLDVLYAEAVPTDGSRTGT